MTRTKEFNVWLWSIFKPYKHKAYLAWIKKGMYPTAAYKTVKRLKKEKGKGK